MTFFSWSLALWSVEDVEKWLHLRQNSVRLVERLLMGELSEQLCGSNNVHNKCAFPYQLYIMRPWRSPDTAYKTNSTVIYSHENATAMNYVIRNSPEMFWNRLKWYLIQLGFFLSIYLLFHLLFGWKKFLYYSKITTSFWSRHWTLRMYPNIRKNLISYFL